MFRILESQAPAKQTATDTINTLSTRLQSATLLEDRRAAILGLRSFAKTYPASVASGALRDLISSLKKDADDVDTIKVVLETLLMLFAPDESSPEASDEIALWLADEFTQRQDNIIALLDLLDARDFYSRLYSLQLMSHISAARPGRTQESVFMAPLGISRLVNMLTDVREPIRNEALVLLIALTPSSPELQKVVTFENGFERIFSLIEAEGSLTHGSEVAEDCLSLLANLLRFNVSNQSYFREAGCVKRLASLLTDAAQTKEIEGDIPEWSAARRDKNIWGLLAVIQLFLVRGSVNTSVNQVAFWQNGVPEQVLHIAFNRESNVNITAKALMTCADSIRGNPALQEKFAEVEVHRGTRPHRDNVANGNAKSDGIQEINVIEALLKLTLETASIYTFDARLAACECMKAFFMNHSGIRRYVLRRAIDGHISGNDRVPNILSILLETPEAHRISDPYTKWIASVLMFHLIFEDPGAKAMAMEVIEGDVKSGEEVVTCVQTIVSNLITGMQRGDDERLAVGYLMLLCGWLFEDPDVTNDFLGEGSSIQSLIQVTNQGSLSNTLIPGLCSVLLGIVYEFSSKDSPITRETIYQLLTNRLGRDQYIDKITKLREHPLIRDFEVLPQSSQGELDGGLPDVFFDKTFVEFLKDNFSRLIRSIDRDPDYEIPIMANGIQKGISRQLLDSLQVQLEDRNQIIEKLESDLLATQKNLEQEQLDSRVVKESMGLEISRIKQINGSLQRSHEGELSKLEEQSKHNKNELLKQHGEQLRAIDNQLKETIADYERKSNKVRQHHEAEVSDLRAAIQTLESNLQEAREARVQGLQTAHKEYTAQHLVLEARSRRAEEKAEKADEHARITEARLREAQRALATAKLDAEEKEKSRKDAQNELEDLLIVFGDLEAKRNQDKERLRELGQEVSDGEDDSNGEENLEDEDVT